MKENFTGNFSHALTKKKKNLEESIQLQFNLTPHNNKYHFYEY